MIASAVLSIANLASTAVPPVVIAAGISAGAGLLKQILANNSEIRQIQEDLLSEQRDFTKRLNRISRGDLTQQESQNIARTVTQAVQPALASRGLSRSPVAAEAIGGAVGQATTNFQSQAQAQLPGAQLAAQQTAMSLLGDDSFFSDLSAIAQNVAFLKAQNGGQSESDPVLDSATRALMDFFESEQNNIVGGF